MWDYSEEEEDERWWHAPSIMPLLRMYGAEPAPDPNGLRGGLSLVDPSLDGGLSLVDSPDGQLALPGPHSGQPLLTDSPVFGPPAPLLPSDAFPIAAPADPIGAMSWPAETLYNAHESIESQSVTLGENTGFVDFPDLIGDVKNGWDWMNVGISALNFASNPLSMDPQDLGRAGIATGSLLTDGAIGAGYDSTFRQLGAGNILDVEAIAGYYPAKAYNSFTGAETPRPPSLDLVMPLAKDAFGPSGLQRSLIDPYFPYVEGAAQLAGLPIRAANAAIDGASDFAEATLEASIFGEPPGTMDPFEARQIFAREPGGIHASPSPELPPLPPDIFDVNPSGVAPWADPNSPVGAFDPTAPRAAPFDQGFVVSQPDQLPVVADPAGTAIVPFDDAITPTTLPDGSVHMPAGGLTAGQLGTAAGFGGAAGAGLSVAGDAYRALWLGEDVSLGEVGANAAFGATTGAAGDVGSEIVSHGITKAVGSEVLGAIGGGGIADAAIAGIGSTLQNGSALENGEIDAAHATANVMVDTGIGLGGGLTGAAIGAGIGSLACPVVGTTIGAGLGFVGGAVGSMGVSWAADASGFTDWAKAGIGDNLGWAEDPLKAGWSGVNGAIDGAMTGLAVGGAGGAAMGAIGTGAPLAALGFCMGGPLGALALGGLGAGIGAVGGGLIGAGLGVVPGMGIGAGLGLGQGLSDWWNGTNVPPQPGELA